MKFISATALLFLVVSVAPVKAQFAGYDSFCGLPTFVQPERQMARATYDPRVGPLIILDPSVMANMSTSRIFAIAHECAHHALGHLSPSEQMARRWGATARQELDADCWAARALASIGYGADIVRMIRQNALEGPYMRGGYPSGFTRAQVISDCAGF